MHILVHLKDTLTLGERRMRVLPLWLVLGSVPVYILAETCGCTGKCGDGIWEVGPSVNTTRFCFLTVWRTIESLLTGCFSLFEQLPAPRHMQFPHPAFTLVNIWTIVLVILKGAAQLKTSAFGEVSWQCFLSNTFHQVR